MFCRDWLAQLGRHQAEIEAAGLRVVAVGIGEPKHAQRYLNTYEDLFPATKTHQQRWGYPLEIPTKPDTSEPVKNRGVFMT